MGLLDDAIRDHLDLKRRRGADPTEMERLEREALGPVRRGPQEAGLDETPAPPYPDEAQPDWSEEAPHAASVPAPEPPHEEEPEPEAPSAAETALFDHESDRPAPAPASAAAPVDEPPAPPVDISPPAPEAQPTPVPADDDYLGQETAEYDVEAQHALEHEEEQAPRGGEHPSDREAHGEDDVLEETPEFLQDTPDHDRLWFEQRPPRDFDFDE